MLGTVLALDVATTTGWAWHRPGMPRPFFGAWKLPADPMAVGQPIAALESNLRQLYIDLKPVAPITHFFYEMPFLDPRKLNATTLKRLYGLAGVVEKFAFQVGATSCFEIQLQEWRKHFIGRAGPFLRDKTLKSKPYLPGQDPKELAIQRCAHYGWYTDIHDAAEACGILDYALTMIPDYERPWRDNALLGGIS